MAEPDVSSPRNVYIIGAQSTGKTTLLNAIRAHFESVPQAAPTFIEETARIVFTQQGWKFTDVDPRREPARYLDLQRLILEMQFEAERAALDRCDWFVSDRSGLDCLVYAAHFLSSGAAAELARTDEWAELKARMAGARIVMCEPEEHWLVDDGTGHRPMPAHVDEWRAVQSAFADLLKEMGWKYEVVPAKVTEDGERVRLAVGDAM